MSFFGVLPENPGFATQLARNLGGGLGKGVATTVERLIDKRIQDQENEGLKRLTGKDFSGVSPQMKKVYLEKYNRTPQHERVIESLLNQGVSPEDAELYAMLTTGGQTAFVKDLLESKKRGFSPVSQSSNQMQPQKELVQDAEKEAEEEMNQIIADQDLGLTPAEKVKRGAERFKTGLPIYQAAGDKLRSFAHQKRNLDILEELRQSKKLPKGFGRLNVDSEGNLKFPFLSSKEAQRFVKIVNEFASGAKDTYGSRVTNFDLAQYLKQFPNLLNSDKGIKDLIQHIKIVNDINAVYYKNLKEVFDKSGGVRGIDADVAQSIAEKKSEKQIQKLVKKFDDIGFEDKLPAANKNKGQRFQDEDTGEIYVSDGTSWIKEG